MPALVFGATSQIGHFLPPRIVAAGGHVIACSSQPRSAGEGDGVQWLHGSLPDAVPAMPALRAVVSVGPLDALARWLSGFAQAPAPRLVATSSISVLSKRDSQVPAERELIGRLAAGEAQLA